MAMGASPADAAKGPQGIDLYSRFALAGALGCSVTHGSFTPVDVYVALSLFQVDRERERAPAND